mmetsp:Transcript_8896/g.26887  ORF Transcript_8896/g.26887 Transcript_8896/m.26887 type:complete len:230 (-) Transcript_8896:1463-2152(-)
MTAGCRWPCRTTSRLCKTHDCTPIRNDFAPARCRTSQERSLSTARSLRFACRTRGSTAASCSCQRCTSVHKADLRRGSLRYSPSTAVRRRRTCGNVLGPSMCELWNILFRTPPRRTHYPCKPSTTDHLPSAARTSRSPHSCPARMRAHSRHHGTRGDTSMCRHLPSTAWSTCHQHRKGLLHRDQQCCREGPSIPQRSCTCSHRWRRRTSRHWRTRCQRSHQCWWRTRRQ